MSLTYFCQFICIITGKVIGLDGSDLHRFNSETIVSEAGRFCCNGFKADRLLGIKASRLLGFKALNSIWSISFLADRLLGFKADRFLGFKVNRFDSKAGGLGCISGCISGLNCISSDFTSTDYISTDCISSDFISTDCISSGLVDMLTLRQLDVE